MGQGLQVFRADGTLTFNSADRLSRIIKIESAQTSPLLNQDWVRVIPEGYEGDVWGYIIPQFSTNFGATWIVRPGIVDIDPIGHPGQIKVISHTDPAYPELLVYGVY